MELIGKATINPWLFYSGKICGYFTWIVLGLSIKGIINISMVDMAVFRYAAGAAAAAGFVLIILSFIWLGRSVRLGLPAEKTSIKTTGIYSISRNPMYAGFNLLTMASIIYTCNPFVLAAGIYSVFVYHLIIKGEEQFMLSRFGRDYVKYAGRVKRYI